jgi:hypothetical protein
MRHSASLVRSIARLTLDGTRMVGRDGMQRWRGRRGAKLDALDRRNRIPLRSLYADFPEARSHVRREVGLRSIPLDEIAGTAVAGGAQRGSDFKPMPAFRGQNWEARWHRLSRATNDLTILPPIDVMRFADRYWVEDGHNRVAAALRNGQVEIDAAVTDLRSPSATTTHSSSAPLAPMLEEGRELRAAGEGRFSAEAASLLASTADDAEHGHGHAHDDAPGDDDEHTTQEGEGAGPTEDASPKGRRRIRRMPGRPGKATAAAAAAAADATDASVKEGVEEVRPKRRRARAGPDQDEATALADPPDGVEGTDRPIAPSSDATAAPEAR